MCSSDLTITEGLVRIDIQLESQTHHSEPTDVLKHIKAAEKDAIYVLADFHHYLEDPVHIRLLKDIALDYPQTGSHIILMSHAIELPNELTKFSTNFELAMPNKIELEKLIHDTADEWARKNPKEKDRTDRKTVDAFINNLSGLNFRDAR